MKTRKLVSLMTALILALSLVPAFATEEVEEITDLELRIGNVFDQEINNYITGKKSMEQWNELVEMLKAQGTERLEEIFNAAYDRIR